MSYEEILNPFISEDIPADEGDDEGDGKEESPEVAEGEDEEVEETGL